MLNAKVIIGKCINTKNLFGIRSQQINNNQWECNWAFPIDENYVKNEKYDNQIIEGELILSTEYPGCPYCNNSSFIKCGICENITCYDNSNTITECASCGNKVKPKGNIKQFKSTSI